MSAANRVGQDYMTWADENNAGVVVQPDAGGHPSYGFRTRPGAPYAPGNEPPTLRGENGGPLSNNQWAATFKGNSPLGVSKGFDPNSSAVANAASETYGWTNPNPTMGLQSVIADAERYHMQNGLPLPKQNDWMKTAQQGMTQVAPYVDEGAPMKTEYPGPSASRDVTKRLAKMNQPEPLF